MLRSFAGGDLFGDQWGSGPPGVLALHGWRRTHDDFAGAIGPASPAGPCDAIAVDLPGFGATPPPPEAWGSADYAALLARMLDAGGPGSPDGPVVVLGHSFGGRVAVHLAASRPDLVRALVLTAAPVARPPEAARRRPPAQFRIVRALHRAHLLPESALERARNKYGSPDYVAAKGVMRQVLVRLLAERYDEQLAALRCGVELVWGDDDAEVPLSVARSVVSLVPRAALTVCPGAGHLTPLTAPDSLRQAVERALAAPPSAGAR
ncbi:MAG: alpha/beta fold hydrolase [Acidimicrobiales bacterium]